MCAQVLNLEDNRIIDYEEGRRQPCEQVTFSCKIMSVKMLLSQVLVVATGPEECGMVVPPAKELPSQQTPEVDQQYQSETEMHSFIVLTVIVSGYERHELFYGGRRTPEWW